MLTVIKDPYCDNCPAFEPDVDREKVYRFDGSFEKVDTFVSCANRKFCHNLVRYLTAYLKKEDENGDR